MSDEDNISQLINHENINFIIIKNSPKILTPEEYTSEALNLCDKFKNCSNLNMNILFIHNVIESECKESSDFEVVKNKDLEAEEIKLLNCNINIILLKNIINIRGFNK